MTATDGGQILAGTDGSQASARAVELAAREARLHGTSLRIVSVASMPPRMTWQHPAPGQPDTVADAIRKTSEQALSTAVTSVTAAEPGLHVTTELLPGAPEQVLVEAAAGAGMLVIGSRGSGGFASLVLGSVSYHVPRHAACPVLVIRADSDGVHGQVAVGIRDPDHPVALGFAFEEASLRGAGLHAVLALHPGLTGLWRRGPAGSSEAAGAAGAAGEVAAAEWLAGLLGTWQQKYPGVPVTRDVVPAHPGRALAGASATADLLVLGRGSRDRASGRGRGAVTHAVLHHAHCPVAVVPE